MLFACNPKIVKLQVQLKQWEQYYLIFLSYEKLYFIL